MDNEKAIQVEKSADDPVGMSALLPLYSLVSLLTKESVSRTNRRELRKNTG